VRVAQSAARPAAVRSFDRRGALCAAAASVFSGALQACAYDTIPVVEPDFAAAEKLRKEREVAAAANIKALKPYLSAIGNAKNGKEWEDAADNLSVYVIGCPRADPKGTSSRKACLDGVPIKSVAATVKETYETLPRFYFRCPPGEEKRDGSDCSSPGLSVDNSYASLIKELRRGTVIQTGDFRRVELFQF